MFNLRVETQLRCLSFHQRGEFENVEAFRELVENAILAGLRWVQDRELDTTQSVANVEEAATLTALAVHRDRNLSDRLHAKTVKRGAEHIVIVKAGRKLGIHA